MATSAPASRAVRAAAYPADPPPMTTIWCFIPCPGVSDGVPDLVFDQAG
jgi:hypothetical protein